MIEAEVPAALGGERIDRVVALVAEVSRSTAHTLIDGGFVTVDGAVVTSGKAKLHTGQLLQVDPAGIPGISLPEADPSVEFRIVYEDDAVIVIDKPAGLVVHPATGNQTGTLVNGLLARYPELAEVGEPQRPGIVHRLDAGTSGLLVVGRTAEAHATLGRRLAAHDVDREYLALVWGHPEATQGLIDAPIGRSPKDPLKMAVVVSGKPARTRFDVLETFSEPLTALVHCELETGRTHQIRVHLAAIGHPVVSDVTYGGKRHGMTLNRPFLHAIRLAFEHPITDEPMAFESPLAEDLVAAMPVSDQQERPAG